MNQKPFKASIIMSIGIIIILFTLGFLYYRFQRNESRSKYLKNGGFNRKQLGIKLYLNDESELPEDFYSLVGVTPQGAYIRDYTNNNLILVNHKKKEIVLNMNDIAESREIFNVLFNKEFDHLLLTINNKQKVVSIPVQDLKNRTNYQFTQYFDKLLPLQSDHYAMINNDTGRTNLMSLNIVEKKPEAKELILAQSNFKIKSMQEDGIFLKWGQSNFVYVNFYTNYFFTADSSLRKIFSAHTIDTISTLPVLKTLKNNSIVTFAEQPRLVNKLACVTGNLLFINSLVKANNEDSDVMKRSNIFDIYDLANHGQYLGTAYVDKYNGQNIYDFKVENGMMVLLYPNHYFNYGFQYYLK